MLRTVYVLQTKIDGESPRAKFTVYQLGRPGRNEKFTWEVNGNDSVSEKRHSLDGVDLGSPGLGFEGCAVKE